MMVVRAQQTAEDLLGAAGLLHSRGWQREHNAGAGIAMTIPDALAYHIGGSFNRLVGPEGDRFYAAMAALNEELSDPTLEADGGTGNKVHAWNRDACPDVDTAVSLLCTVGLRLMGETS